MFSWLSLTVSCSIVVPIPMLIFFFLLILGSLLFISRSSCDLSPVDALSPEFMVDPNRRKIGNGFREEREPATRPKLNSMAIQYRDDAESSVVDRQYNPGTEYGRRIRGRVCSHVRSAVP